MRTLRLKQLVEEVLASIPAPHTKDVIEDVFAAIEHAPAWRKTYDEVVYALGKPTANAWAAFWISHAESRVGDERATATRTSLIESYSVLTERAPKRAKKVKKPEALKAMHDHFESNRASLPPSIRDHREVIVTLIMEGIGPEAAFAKAIEKPALAQ
ncbi:MAG: hypothetical protein ACXWHB_13150 [Usitatibacter sp.]